MVYFIEAGETCYAYDPVGNLTKQTLRDLPSAFGLTKTFHFMSRFLASAEGKHWVICPLRSA